MQSHVVRSCSLVVALMAGLVLAIVPEAAAQPLTCGGLTPTITGTPGPDVIDGTSGDDVIAGGAGDDVIRAGGGNDVICGDAGLDVLVGGPGSDLIYGGTERDVIRGGKGADRAYGGAGDDKLFGGSGDDELRGEEGNDRLEGGSAFDELMGGDGDDVLKGQKATDRLSGGAGDDDCGGGGAPDFAEASCETVSSALELGEDVSDLDGLTVVSGLGTNELPSAIGSGGLLIDSGTPFVAIQTAHLPDAIVYAISTRSGGVNGAIEWTIDDVLVPRNPRRSLDQGFSPICWRVGSEVTLPNIVGIVDLTDQLAEPGHAYPAILTWEADVTTKRWTRVSPAGVECEV